MCVESATTYSQLYAAIIPAVSGFVGGLFQYLAQRKQLTRDSLRHELAELSRLYAQLAGTLVSTRDFASRLRTPPAPSW